MGAALGLGAGPGDIVVSIGTSGVVSAVSPTSRPPTHRHRRRLRRRDRRATSRWCARSTRLGCSTPAPACSASTTRASRARPGDAPAGAGGLVLVPYLEGERTPEPARRHRRAARAPLGTSTPAHLARAAVEGLLCGLADGSTRCRGERAGRAGAPGRWRRPGRRPSRRIAPAVLGAPGRRAAARRVRRGRRRATGGLGARGRRRAAGLGGGRARAVHRPSPRRTCASATPRPATSR